MTTIKKAISVKYQFCLSSGFFDTYPVLNHLCSYIFELHTQDPATFKCALCNAHLPSLIDAIAHVKQCGIQYCAIFFQFPDPVTAVKMSPTTGLPITVRLLERIVHAFVLPTQDPFPPDHCELARHAKCTAEFLVEILYFVLGTITGSSVSLPWDFLFHHNMVKKCPTDMSFQHLYRGKDYNRELHVKTSSPYTLVR